MYTKQRSRFQCKCVRSILSKPSFSAHLIQLALVVAENDVFLEYPSGVCNSYSCCILPKRQVDVSLYRCLRLYTSNMAWHSMNILVYVAIGPSVVSQCLLKFACLFQLAVAVSRFHVKQWTALIRSFVLLNCSMCSKN